MRRVLDELLDTRRSLEARLDDIQAGAASFRDETLSNFDGTFHRLEILEAESRAISAGLSRVERSLESDSIRKDELRREIAELRDRLARLERRLAEIDPQPGGTQ